jgi:hypothetical protein
MAAWFAKGAPCSEKTLGSYEECTAITGGVLEFLEVPDFLANLGDSAPFVTLCRDGVSWSHPDGGSFPWHSPKPILP